METIHHIKTGGTIGGCVPEYKEIEILSDAFADAINIDKYLNQSLKITAKYTEKSVCHKDSREISEDDQLAIANSIASQHANGTRKFLVTHGTYTMPETAKYIQDNLDQEILSSSIIVITGCMFPWNLIGSDAPINLGAALGILLNTEKPRVAICMHAKLFAPEHVEKDADNLIFKEV